MSDTQELEEIDYYETSYEKRVEQYLKQFEEANALRKTIVKSLIVTFSIFFIIGAILNLVVIVVQVVNKQWKTTMNILVLNLAAADFIFILCTYLVFLQSMLLQPWIFGEVLCKLLHFSLMTSFAVSMYTLVLFSLDCFLAIVFPIVAIRLRTVRNCLALIAAVWPVMALAITPNVIQITVKLEPVASEDIYQCMQSGPALYTEIYIFVITLVIPLLLMLGLYLTMAISVWQRPTLHSSSSSDQLTRARRKKVAIRVSILIGTFALCVSPIQVASLAESLCQVTDICWTNDPMNTLILYVICCFLLLTNSCLNPVIYSFLLPGFRKALSKTCGCKLTPTTSRASHEMTALSNLRSA